MISNLVHVDWIEPAAVILAIAYLLLAVKQNISCWFAAFFSSLLYFFVMYSAGLYMEAGLQIFYCVMAVYGWTQWRTSLPNNKKFLVKSFKAIFTIQNHSFIAISLKKSFNSDKNISPNCLKAGVATPNPAKK